MANHSYFIVKTVTVKGREVIKVIDDGDDRFEVATFKNGYFTEDQVRSFMRLMYPGETEICSRKSDVKVPGAPLSWELPQY